MIEIQKKVGIRANATPVTYDRYFNPAIYNNAVKMGGAK